MAVASASAEARPIFIGAFIVGLRFLFDARAVSAKLAHLTAAKPASGGEVAHNAVREPGV
jgi:UDP-N-acetylglucosamine enolpyruvyl transferase